MATSPILKILSPDDISGAIVDPVDPTALIQAREIVNDVENDKTRGLIKHAVRLGDIESENAPYVISKEEMKKAFDSLPEDQKMLLVRTKDRIESFAKAQMGSISPLKTEIPGGFAGHTLSPVSVAGCYAPGGRYPLPSSVLMTAVTARTAGVKKVIVSSPRPSVVTIATAHVAGADLFLCVGGAQAIAAMAFGLTDSSIPKCDIIVGPGNKWVTAAKSIIQGRCAIDMLAGPSEVLVIADEKANPDVIAADLLAQAEHDVEARPILVTTSRNLASEVNDRLALRLKELSTKDTALEACKKGFIVLCEDLDTAIRVSDMIAPEHLEIQTENAQAVADRCLHYGGIFIGENAAEVLGDYGAGPNHVLPTGGTGRYTGGLSIFNFLRIRTWMRIDDLEEAKMIVEDSVKLAKLEGLEGHAKSAQCRLKSK